MDNDEADGRDALLEEGPYAGLNSKDVLARMAFWIKIMGSDNGKVDTSICPAVQGLSSSIVALHLQQVWHQN